MNIAVIFAGGVGRRMNTKDRPKQFLLVHGKPIIVHTIEIFEHHQEIDGIIVVCVEDWIPYMQEMKYRYRLDKIGKIVPGGETGQLSIYNGLCAARDVYGVNDNIVLIHDGVRPLIDERTISDNIHCVQKTAGVKARDDADCIFKECGLEELLVENSSKGRGGNFVIRLISHATVNAAWKRTLEKLNSGDKVFVQFPCIEHSIFLSNTLKKLTERGVEIVLLIHDLELLRISKRKDVSLAKRVRLRIEEKNTLLCATKIIAHNDSMKKFLSDMGVEEKRIRVLEIFDYLILGFSEE